MSTRGYVTLNASVRMGVIERDLCSRLPVCLPAVFFLKVSHEPAVPPTAAALLSLVASVCRFYKYRIRYLHVCIMSRNADLISRHSHFLQTRTITCATMIAASVSTHAVVRGRRQLSSSSMSISAFLISAAAFTHITTHCLRSFAYQSLRCQLKMNITCRVLFKIGMPTVSSVRGLT